MGCWEWRTWCDMAMHLKLEGVTSAADYLTKTMSKQKGGSGSVTLLRPDGTEYPGSPFRGGGLPGPWAVVVDGNDNVWVSNFAMPASPIVQLCGARTENCPPGMKTGDQISPPVAMSAAAYRCRPISRSHPRAMSGGSTTGRISTAASASPMKRCRPAVAVRAS